MYYSNITMHGYGLTNQIFSLITSIILANKNKEKVVIVDKFLNDYSKNNYTPISQIFDLPKMNIFLKETYGLIMIDKHDANFKIDSVKYGTVEKNIDLTDLILEKFYKNNVLHIKKNTNLNDIKGDPCFGIKKQIFLNYTINNYFIEEMYPENLKSDVSIDILNSKYKKTFNWINSHNKNMFENILIHIDYSNEFIEKSMNLLHPMGDIKKKKINVIHLRLEDDAIKHWSKINHISENDFKHQLENKYINLIQKYVSKTDENILLSSSLHNKVIDFLVQNQYLYKFNEKYFEDREKNAIVDLLTGSYGNHLFIGNFNFKRLNGSTFSYYIGKRLDKKVKQIYIDLDHILDEAVIL